MGQKSRTAQFKLAQIASRAHGVVTRAEALRAGITQKEIRHRLETGALIAVYRGVYRVGHIAPSVEARYMAAVRACGEGALLSGRAAAYLHGLLKGSAPPAEVTTRTERKVPGVRTRRSRGLNPPRGTLVRGLPVTGVADTLVDFAADASFDELARACHEADIRDRRLGDRVESVLAFRTNAPRAKTLRAILRGDAPITLSGLERRFHFVLREDGLLVPDSNRYIDGRAVDCRWPARKLTVELDSYRYHRSRHAWERDRRREREARARGDDFRRFTHDDVFEHTEEMLIELRPIISP